VSNKWDKEELTRLYVEDGLTLEAIGQRYGVSRERVRQVVEKFGLKRHVSNREPEIMLTVICPDCNGKGFRELDKAGLIRVACRKCQ